MNRPGLQALMRQIEARAIKVVVIYKLERMLRCTGEWATFRAFLEKHGCRLVSPSENLSDATPSGRLKTNLLMSVAEYERLNTSDKVRAKMLEQAKRGFWNAGQVPYGYNYDACAQMLLPNAVETSVVQRIFEMASQLFPLTEIAAVLNDEDIKTRTRIFRRRDGSLETVGGKRFRTDSLQKLINNPIYVGRVRFRGEEFAGRHQAIIAPVLWDQAKAALARSAELPACRLQPRDKGSNLLKGLLFCGCCGQAMTPKAGGKLDAQGRPYRYYTCDRLRKEKEAAICPIRHVSALKVETTVIEFIGSIARTPKMLDVILKADRAVDRPDQTALKNRLATLDTKLTALNRRITNCVEAVMENGVGSLTEAFRVKASAMEEEKQRLLVEREQVRQELMAGRYEKLDADRIIDALSRFQEVFAHLNPAEKRQLVFLCIARIDLRLDDSKEQTTERRLELRLHLQARELVESMEEHVVVQLGKPASRRAFASPVALDIELCLKPRPAPRQPSEAACLHPLHRAIAWQRELSENPKLIKAELAQREGVSAATLTHHFKLLQLTPEIQDFLLGLRSAADIRRFSLNRMKALAEFEPTKQLLHFSAMKVEQPSRN